MTNPDHDDTWLDCCPPGVSPDRWQLFGEVLDFLDRLDAFEAGFPLNEEHQP